VIALAPIETGEQRRAFFAQCLDEFGATLRAQGIQPPQTDLPPDRLERIISGEGYERPLAVQMEALLHLMAATPDAPGIDKQLDSVLGLERAHWDKLLGALDREAKRDMDRGVAQVTAVHGTPDQPAAEHLLMADAFYDGRRAARADVEPLYSKLATVYGAADGALMQLEPDLIGEHQVASIGDAELIEGCLRWIEGLPEEDREQRQRDLITLLQRASLPEHGDKARDRAAALLGYLVDKRLSALAEAMVAVMTETPGQLEGILTARIGQLDDEPLAALDEALPQQTVTLMDFALAVAERRAGLARRQLESLTDDANEETQLAALHHLAARVGTLGIRLSSLGRREDALSASQEAVDIRRRLAAARPDAFLPDLASSLNNLGRDLSNLGRREEALSASQAAVDIYRRLAAARPNAFLPDLARRLNNTGAMLSNLGRREDALSANQEAVDIYRRLAAARPDAFLSDLAASLNNLGNRLSDLGRREEALAASQEAVDIRRRLAAARPDAFLPDLARSLGAQGQILRALDRHGDSANAFEEGLKLITPLLQQHPQAFAGLAGSLRQDYLAACASAERAPDPDVLEPVNRVLGAPASEAGAAFAQFPDAVVEQVFAAPQLQALVADILKQGGIDGAPDDQPMEIKRPIVAALIQQGIVQISDGEERD